MYIFGIKFDYYFHHLFSLHRRSRGPEFSVNRVGYKIGYGFRKHKMFQYILRRVLSWIYLQAIVFFLFRENWTTVIFLYYVSYTLMLKMQFLRSMFDVHLVFINFISILIKQFLV